MASARPVPPNGTSRRAGAHPEPVRHGAPAGRGPPSPARPGRTARTQPWGWDAPSRCTPTSTCRPTSARRRSPICRGSRIRPSCGTQRRCRDRRRAVRRHGHPSARHPVRAARDPRGAVHSGGLNSLQLDVAAVRGADGRRRRRREHRPGPVRPRPRHDLPQGPRGRGDRRDPDHPRRRPLDHLAERQRVAEVRRPGSIGIVHFDAHADTAPDSWGQLASHGVADAPADRVGRRPGATSSRSGCAATGRRPDVLDWMREHGLRWHLMTRDRGARRRGGHRRRDRGGARWPGRDLPVRRHRRRRSRLGARDRHARARRDAPARAAARRPPDRRRGRARGHGHRRGLAAVRLGRVDRDDRQPRAPWRRSRRSRSSSAPARPVRFEPRRGRRARWQPRQATTLADAMPTERRARRRDRAAVRPRPRDDPGDIDSTWRSRSAPAGRSWSSRSGQRRIAVPLAEAGTGRRRRHRSGDDRPGRALARPAAAAATGSSSSRAT